MKKNKKGLYEYFGYNDVAKIKGENELFFEMFGEYQGEWLLITEKDGTVKIYKDYFGSCSGCDALVDFLGWEGNTISQLKEFSSNYKPFLEFNPSDYDLSNDEDIKALIPKNIATGLVDGWDLKLNDVVKAIKGCVETHKKGEQ